MFIYKFTKIIEQVKKSSSFFKKYKLYKYIAWEILALKMRNLQGIEFIQTQTNS